MHKLLIGWMLTWCISLQANPLSWWLLPDSIEDLPHEVEEDDAGHWTELWVRNSLDTEVPPGTVMEQVPGARWVGTQFGKNSKPNRVILVLADRRIVDLNSGVTRAGNINGNKISWNDGKEQALVEYKKRRHRRSRRKKSIKVNFGKVSIPALVQHDKNMNAWAMEGLARFLEKIPELPNKGLTNRDYSTLAQLEDPNGSLLGFRYSDNCSFDERSKIEDAIAIVDKRLSCWMESNPNDALKVLAALLQRPTIQCRSQLAPKEACGMASTPIVDGFFALRPEVSLNLKCEEDLSSTVLHEVFHLAGVSEAQIEKANEAANSCQASPALLSFENSGEGFFNDSQVETRIFLFKKIQEEAVEKWGWSKGERDFFLGIICSKMNDICARRYFQLASESNSLAGLVHLPENTTVTWSSLAQFNLFNSIPEDLYRMRELVRYLQRDPQGVLIKRLETSSHRAHEFFVARSMLEAVKDNRGVCAPEISERVYCEDLASIVKTPWFKNQ